MTGIGDRKMLIEHGRITNGGVAHVIFGERCSNQDDSILGRLLCLFGLHSRPLLVPMFGGSGSAKLGECKRCSYPWVKPIVDWRVISRNGQEYHQPIYGKRPSK